MGDGSGDVLSHDTIVFAATLRPNASAASTGMPAATGLRALLSAQHSLHVAPYDMASWQTLRVPIATCPGTVGVDGTAQRASLGADLYLWRRTLRSLRRMFAAADTQPECAICQDVDRTTEDAVAHPRTASRCPLLADHAAANRSYITSSWAMTGFCSGAPACVPPAEAPAHWGVFLAVYVLAAALCLVLAAFVPLQVTVARLASPQRTTPAGTNIRHNAAGVAASRPLGNSDRPALATEQAVPCDGNSGPSQPRTWAVVAVGSSATGEPVDELVATTGNTTHTAGRRGVTAALPLALAPAAPRPAAAGRARLDVSGDEWQIARKHAAALLRKTGAGAAVVIH